MAVKTKMEVAPISGVDQLHSIKETCATLRIGPTKCWELINNGLLDVVRLGNRCTRVRKSSIDTLITGGVAK